MFDMTLFAAVYKRIMNCSCELREYRFSIKISIGHAQDAQLVALSRSELSALYERSFIELALRRQLV